MNKLPLLFQFIHPIFDGLWLYWYGVCILVGIVSSVECDIEDIEDRREKEKARNVVVCSRSKGMSVVVDTSIIESCKSNT